MAFIMTAFTCCQWVLDKMKIPRAVAALGILLVRPTGFEPAAFRVGVIRRSNAKHLQRSRFIDSTQIGADL